MADPKFVEKSLLEKIVDLLGQKEENYVTFCVGKEKKVVRALKVILKVSSSFLEKEFNEKWDVDVVKAGDGIPRPDFDPIAFELCVKLTSLDIWSLNILKTLNLPLNQILNLLLICRRFEMTKPVEILEELVAAFTQSFGEYKDTDDFLQLSQTNLKSVLVSDDIVIEELAVFHAAMRWAEFQCKEMKVEPTAENIREVLGDCLFEIRFPIMTSAEFMKTVESTDILTAEEALGIYRFIELEATTKLEFKAKKFPFKTVQRKQVLAMEPKPNSENDSSGALVPPGMSILSLTRDARVLENPLFVCDGRKNLQFINCENKIMVFGLGFLGPTESDGFYDVKVQIEGRHEFKYDSGMLEKRIFAEKGKIFYFVFDSPINLEESAIDQSNKYYRITYWLKGANTASCRRSLRQAFIVQTENTKLRVHSNTNQLEEILFNLI